MAVYTLFLFLLAAIWTILRIKDSKIVYGIVTKQPCELKSGPQEDYKTAMALPEGKKVIIISQKDQWYAVGLPLERYKGWVKKENIEVIKQSRK